uniref:Argininosuccinate lyase n=1 Tax=Lygus hesperus TaxID=30085 RepID=A0A0A9W7M6_LYGHE
MVNGASQRKMHLVEFSTVIDLKIQIRCAMGQKVADFILFSHYLVCLYDQVTVEPSRYSTCFHKSIEFKMSLTTKILSYKVHSSTGYFQGLLGMPKTIDFIKSFRFYNYSAREISWYPLY